MAARTLDRIREWPPVLPVFGQITPFPATPLYDRLEKAGRLTRPKHWLEFAPFQMAHTPLKLTIPEVQAEVRHAWTHSYSTAATKSALASIADAPVPYKISHLMARLFFRGIYFRQKGAWQWLKLVAQNRGSIFQIVRDSFTKWNGAKDLAADFNGDPSAAPLPPRIQPETGPS